MRESDCGQICLISSAALGYSCKIEDVRKRITELDNDRERVFVAEADGKAVGYIHAEHYKTLYMEKLVNILGLAVLEEYRKIGAGRALLTEAENWAKAEGAAGVRLNSGAQRTEAHRFYRNSGYTMEKEQKRFLKWF